MAEKLQSDGQRPFNEKSQLNEKPPARDRPQPAGRLLTVDDLAAYLQVSTKTVYRMLRAGLLPCYRVAGLWRFRKENIDRWLDDRVAVEPKVVGRDE